MFALSLLMLSGCRPDVQKDTAELSCEGGETIVGVISVISHARRNEGVAWGFNLDDVTSTFTDPIGCFKEDLTDPNGTPGIDNAFSALIPALESTEAVALETLVQDSIYNGNLLLMFEITGVHDRKNDDCVNVGVWRGRGSPLVGTDEALLHNQSFYRDLDLPNSYIEGMQIIDGSLVATPLDIELPVQVLDESLNFFLSDGGIRIDFNEDDTMQGFFGGAVPIEALTDITSLNDVNLPDFVIDLVESAADLYPKEDGSCAKMSLAFEYNAIPAFFTLEEDFPTSETE